MTALKLRLWRGCYAVASRPIILCLRGLLILSHRIWSDGIATPI